MAAGQLEDIFMQAVPLEQIRMPKPHTSHVDIMFDLSYMFRGKFTACVFCGCTAIHNCSSSGSLLFTTLRQNTKNYYCAVITLNQNDL